jgi:hypothetical protein
MTIHSSVVFSADGRIGGGYVYLLLCDGGEDVCIKIGVTRQPEKRLATLVNNCPLDALKFCTLHVWSVDKARQLEGILHAEYAANRRAGEWFRFAPDEKAAFNDTLRRVIADHSQAGWPIKMQSMPVPGWHAARQKRAENYRRKWSLRPKAFRDFVKHKGLSIDYLKNVWDKRKLS